jgi:hypothetical protein
MSRYYFTPADKHSADTISSNLLSHVVFLRFGGFLPSFDGTFSSTMAVCYYTDGSFL